MKTFKQFYEQVLVQIGVEIPPPPVKTKPKKHPMENQVNKKTGKEIK